MKVAYKHLVKNIKQNPDIKDLSEKLFQLGHEHEVKGEVLELELTPNRGDCLSIDGLLRDLNLFYDVEISNNIYKEEIKEFSFDFINNAEEACRKISFLKIEIDKIPENYNTQLNSYFTCLNNKKNNFFTDVSNYISYETGQPTHCYEESSVRDGIKLDYFENQQDFKTLLDQTIKLKDKNLVFFNKKDEIINLAGIIGGKKSSCTDSTTSVILECAYFDPEAILGKAVKYSISSDAAHKFERNVDPDSHEYVIRRFIQIIAEHTNILNLEIFTKNHSPSIRNEIKFSLEKINNILGTNIKEKDCLNYLKRLGFEINESTIIVPSYRNDIKNINDISEEIARAIGYDNIKPIPLNLKHNRSKEFFNKDSEKKLKNLLTDNGFFEVINDPFVQVNNNDSVQVDNPLDSKRGYLRTNLRGSLLKNLLYNERRQKDSIKLFEIADVYFSSPLTPKKFIGIIASGRIDKNYEDFSKKLDKKYLSNLLKDISYAKDKFNIEILSRENLHSKSKNTIVYAEFEIDQSFEFNYSAKKTIKNNIDTNYTSISEFPSSSRDLSFSVTDFSKLEYLEEYILKFKDELIKEAFVFDYYLNEKNKEIKIGFRLIFQSTYSTIKEDQVNNIISEMINHTKKIDGISIPGLN